MTVQIHLTIHQDNSDLRIDFPFDTLKDDINQVVAELVETCKLTDEESQELKSIIKTQIASTMNTSQQINTQSSNTSSLSNIPQQAAQMQQSSNQSQNQSLDFGTSSSFAPLDQAPQQQFGNSFFNSDSDDEDVRDDPEYQSLLNQQREELRMIEQRHQSEQKDLIVKIQRGTAAPTPATCDDLIIF